MTVLMRTEPGAFDREQLPEWVWTSNLFGRAAHNLVLSEELKRTSALMERELKVVADIQRSLLPKVLPTIPTLDLAAYYQTSQWAGGDYYDFFPLADGKWGILIADVSGHGTPAAVMMAITHSIAHALHGPLAPPGTMLGHVNQQLATRYTADNEAFVTAFYGIYDPLRRELTYASAGHNPPRLKRCEDGSVASLDAVGGLPLGMFADQVYRRSLAPARPRRPDRLLHRRHHRGHEPRRPDVRPRSARRGPRKLPPRRVRPDASRARHLGRLHRRPARPRRPDPGDREGLVSGEWVSGEG